MYFYLKLLQLFAVTLLHLIKDTVVKPAQRTVLAAATFPMMSRCLEVFPVQYSLTS